MFEKMKVGQRISLGMGVLLVLLIVVSSFSAAMPKPFSLHTMSQLLKSLLG